MNIIIDTNLWISFLIGKRLSALKSLSKIRKYVGDEDVADTFNLINRFCRNVVVLKDAVSPVRDVKDLYLLSLADTVKADYIITGDKDLLALEIHNQTKIVSYNDFTAKTLFTT